MTVCSRVITFMVFIAIFYKVADGISEFGDKIGECMPEYECAKLGGVKSSNIEYRCENDVQFSQSTKDRHVFCTTYAHLAKHLCEKWMKYWDDSEKNCSMALHERINRDRVVGGKTAKMGEFKYMVGVGRWYPAHLSYKWECGGSILNPFLVLTAAHCVNDEYEKYFVKVGEHDMSSRREANINKDVIKMELPTYLHRSSEYDETLPNETKLEKIIDVQNVIIHHKYQRKMNDIAILELKEPILLNENVLPICIDFSVNHQVKIGEILTVAGWGKMKYGGYSSAKLKKVQLPVADSNLCQELLQENSFIGINITSKHLCAGKKGFDTCQGDSGGALVKSVPREDGPPCGFQAIGIVSWGSACGLMGVYTRVSSYLNWIMRYIAPDHYYQFIYENIYTGGLVFDGRSMIQFNIDEDVFNNGLQFHLYFKTKKRKFDFISIATEKGSNITLEMEEGKVIFREPLGSIYLESKGSYSDDEWHYLSIECALSNQQCFLKISKEIMEVAWILSSSFEDSVLNMVVIGGMVENDEEPSNHFEGSLVYSKTSSIKLNSIYSSYGMAHANTGSHPAECPRGFFRINGSKCLRMFDDNYVTWQEAKLKCEAEGLVMPTHTDDFAIELRKYLLDNFDDNTHAWLGASGSGSDMVWLQQSGNTNDNQVVGRNNTLWENQEEANEVSTSQCLALWVWTWALDNLPSKPYVSWPCSGEGLPGKPYTLCQSIVNTAPSTCPICPVCPSVTNEPSITSEIVTDSPSTCPACPTVTSEPLIRSSTIKTSILEWHFVDQDYFVVFNQRMNWLEASELCEKFGLVLYQPKNILKVTKYLADKFKSVAGYHLGARGNGTHMVWLSGEVVSQDEPWRGGTSKNVKTNVCLSIRTDQSYIEDGQVLTAYGHSCSHVDHLFQPICGELPSYQLTWHSVGNDVFARYHHRMDWESSRAFCKIHGEDLYDPRDLHSVSAYLNENFDDVVSATYWLGCCNSDGNKLFWSSGKVMAVHDDMWHMTPPSFKYGGCLMLFANPRYFLTNYNHGACIQFWTCSKQRFPLCG